VATVCSRQLQYVTVQPIDAAHAAVAAGTDVDCLVVDRPEGLDAVAEEFPPSFRDSADELRKRVAQGCVACLARRPRVDGPGREIVGYELAERGVFSALGHRYPVGPEVIFSHWAEVLPAHRGQRIHALLFAARDRYFGQRGGRIVCGVVAPKNRASLHALGRAGSRIVTAVWRVSVIGGLLAWQTSWEHTRSALYNGCDPRPARKPFTAMVRWTGVFAKAFAWLLIAPVDQ
jgi:hypothetical protein